MNLVIMWEKYLLCPGCISQGKIIEELKVNITETIEGWLEVMNDKVKKVMLKYLRSLYDSFWFECR